MTEEAKRIVTELREGVCCHGCAKIMPTWDNPYPCSKQERMSDNNDKAADLIESLSEQLEQVTRERDAYLKSIDGLCAACKKAPFCILTPVERCKNWQWKGVEVEG